MTAPSSMVPVPGGHARVGSERFYPEERPVREVEVSDLWVDAHLVTNDEFRRFVEDTGWVTDAERDPDPAAFPGADPALLVAGSQVFTPTPGPVPLDDWQRWWRWQPGADWRHPEGPGSTVAGLDQHPVVHLAWEDAMGYAEWAGKRLPTEVEWEHACRGGLVGAVYPWGDEPQPEGRPRANSWQGAFPYARTTVHDGVGTSEVEHFLPNGYGLFDMTGNVWEWTASPWTSSHAQSPCCAPATAREGERRVIKGGSHLCSPEYCHRYRPAARQGHEVRSSTNHLGFRCVRDR